jgi:thioredoxin 1
LTRGRSLPKFTVNERGVGIAGVIFFSDAADAAPTDRRYAMAIKPVTDESFENDVLKSQAPVLVDFWAEWCGPCKVIAPSLEDLANDLGEKIVVAKVNIDENPDTPSKYGVRGIPTLIIFKDGQVASMKVGSVQKSKLYEWVEQTL